MIVLDRLAPRLGKYCMVFLGHYFQPLSVVPSLGLGEGEDENRQYVNVRLPDELLRALRRFNHVMALQITKKARQSNHWSFNDLLKRADKWIDTGSSSLPLKFTSNVKETYKTAWNWYRTNTKQDVYLEKRSCAWKTLLSMSTARRPWKHFPQLFSIIIYLLQWNDIKPPMVVKEMPHVRLCGQKWHIRSVELLYPATPQTQRAPVMVICNVF